MITARYDVIEIAINRNFHGQVDVQFNIAIIEMVLFIAMVNYQREADTINMEMIFGKQICTYGGREPTQIGTE